MKLLQIIQEEVVPLSRKQNVILLTIIACIFQFLLFFAPVMAAEAVQAAQPGANEADIVSLDGMAKDQTMDPEAAKLATPMAATSTQATTTPKVIRTSKHTITAYNSEAAQTDASPCITANGYNVCAKGVEDTIAANFLPFGTKVKIPELFGDRVFVVRDRMNKRHAERVDVWMKDRSSAVKFGVKVATIQVIE